MGTDHCVDCSRKVTARQHALQCDSCNLWQHRLCNTGISLTEYRRLAKADNASFTCSKCKQREEETTSNPAESTHLESTVSTAPPDYGIFDISLISAATSNTSNTLNTTYTIQDPEPDRSTDSTISFPQPLPELTTTADQEPDQDHQPDLTASFDLERKKHQ